MRSFPATSPAVSARMSRVRTTDTAPELAIRRGIHARGWRYRVNYRPDGYAKTRIDIAFTRRKVAVFVDGCFWHHCPTHGSVPASNRAWWTTKFAATRDRDRATARQLAEMGWTVIRIWEHTDPVEATDQIEATLSQCDMP